MAVDSRMYVVSFAATAATAAVDFFSFAPADDKPVQIHAIYLAQTTEVGDAMEEMLEVKIERGGTGYTVGSGGSAGTIGVLGPSGQAAGFTSRVVDTTKATFTAGEVKHRDAFNVRTGWQYIPTPETRITVVQANGGCSICLPAAPADSISWVGTLLVEEYG